MEYHSMNLKELKEHAKNHKPKIKQYYIKSRLELIKLLTLKEFPTQMILEKKTIDELRGEAKKRGITNIWKLRRAELIDVLYPSPQQDNKDNDGGNKHDNPQKGEGDQVGVYVLKDTT